jgi:hypothetical protein
MLHSKKTLVVIAVLVGLYTIGVNSEPTSTSPAKIEKPKPDKPKEFNKVLNSQACSLMINRHQEYMYDTTLWWENEYSIDQVIKSVELYLSVMENIKTDSDLKPYFRDMITEAKSHETFMKKYRTLDHPKWFEILTSEGWAYSDTTKYCQRYVS